MQTLLELGLPVGLFLIMFWLGLDLSFQDFGRVLKRPGAFLLGILLQVVALPVIAVAIILLWPVPLSSGLVLGMMVLAASPGGLTSNLFTRLAGGDTALSISLTAVMSLASIATVPMILLVAFGALDISRPADASAVGLAAMLFAMVALPVSLGILAKARLAASALRIERAARPVAASVLVALLGLAVIENFDALRDNFGDAAMLALALNLGAMTTSVLAARIFRAQPEQATALAFECGLQSTPTAITIVVILELPAEALAPATFYGIWMLLNASTITALLAFRQRGISARP